MLHSEFLNRRLFVYGMDGWASEGEAEIHILHWGRG